MSNERYEIEVQESGEWGKIGFDTLGGFTPYRYEFPADAFATLDKLYPDLPRRCKRVVKAVSVLKGCADA